jgi:hypothetical protein
VPVPEQATANNNAVMAKPILSRQDSLRAILLNNRGILTLKNQLEVQKHCSITNTQPAIHYML